MVDVLFSCANTTIQVYNRYRDFSGGKINGTNTINYP